MSQAGLIDIESANPQIPTLFIANVGEAVPIDNTLELLGETVAAAGVPFQSVASGNTVTYQVQFASAVSSSDETAVGLASFDSDSFAVDDKGFVTFIGSATVTIDGDTGSVTGDPITFTGGTTGLTFNGSGSIMTLEGILVPANGGTGLDGSAAADGTLLIGTGTGFALANLLSADMSVTITNTSGGIDLSVPAGGGLSLGAFGSTPNADGLTLTAGVLNMEPADGTHPGGVSTGSQTFGGAKEFAVSVSSPIFAVLSGGGGIAQIEYPSSATNYNFNLPADAGTVGYFLTSGGGGSSPMTWTQNTFISSISITGDSGGPLVGSSFTFTGGSTGLTFAGSGSTETLGGLLNSTYGGSGVSNPTAHGIAVGEGSSPFTFLTLTNGQLLIGSTGADPVAATLTAGTGISITNASGSVTISGKGGALSWVVVTGTTQAMAVNTGYVANNAGQVVFTLPTTSAVGDVVAVTGINNATGWQIAQNASQQIFGINGSTTAGTGGSLTSNTTRGTVFLLCVVANLTWNIINVEGNPTVV